VVKIPIEETADFVHVRLLDPDQFGTCRITGLQGRLPRGVRAKYCKYKGRDQWATQAYSEKGDYPKRHSSSSTMRSLYIYAYFHFRGGDICEIEKVFDET